MKLIATKTGRFRTGSELADAVMHYALALTRRRRVDLVDVPVVAADGSQARAQFPVGWQSDISTISLPEPLEPEDELTEVDTAIDLYTRAELVGVTRARPLTLQELRSDAAAGYDDYEIGLTDW